MAIFISLVVHVLVFLLFALLGGKSQLKPVKVTPRAIKSYLYQRPVTVKPKQAVVIKAQLLPELEKPQQKEEAEAVKQVKVEKVKVTENTSNVKASLKAPVTFSAYQQLENLRNTIDKKVVDDEFSQQQRFRSPSVMHGEPIPVPHSEQKLTAEQLREKNTVKMSDSISITKHDNGLCIIEREQFLGSPVEGSSSAFDCGESKFDKSFREHMKKLQAKISPHKSK